MGIQDRAYYREESRHHGVRLRTGGGLAPVTVAVGSACIVVYVVWNLLLQRPPGLNPFAMVPREAIQHFKLWQLVTCVFAHDSFMHILFNLMLFWWFGQELERMYRRLDYIALLVLGALSASLLHCAFAFWQGGHSPDVPVIGASGMVMAVMVTFTCYYPKAPTFLFGLPISVVTAVYVLMDLSQGLSGRGDAIAHFAHLGGAAFGFAFWRWQLLPGEVVERLWKRLTRRRGGDIVPRSVWRGERLMGPVGGVDAGLADDSGDELRRRVDEILEKISTSGEASLTPEERAELEAASRKFRKK